MNYAQLEKAGRVAGRMGSGDKFPGGVQGRSPAYTMTVFSTSDGALTKHGLYSVLSHIAGPAIVRRLRAVRYNLALDVGFGQRMVRRRRRLQLIDIGDLETRQQQRCKLSSIDHRRFLNALPRAVPISKVTASAFNFDVDGKIKVLLGGLVGWSWRLTGLPRGIALTTWERIGQRVFAPVRGSGSCGCDGRRMFAFRRILAFDFRPRRLRLADDRIAGLRVFDLGHGMFSFCGQRSEELDGSA